MRRVTVCCAALCFALSGCKGDKTQPGPSVPPSAIGSVASDDDRHAARSEPYANENLPDEADFADEAEKEITSDNYGAKLGEIEKEIAAAEDAGAPAAPSVTPTAAATATATAKAAATAAATATAKDRAAGAGSAKGPPPGKAEGPDEPTVE
jgi:hypothetical protein